MNFLGDEGRDVMVANEILHGEFKLLGPRSSAGDFYMGPFYYYLIMPFLFLTNFDPVGPAIMVALFGVATVLLIYKVGKDLIDRETGLFAAGLYSVATTVLSYSHSSWNPNVLPFFSLLMMYLVYIFVKEKKSWKYYFTIGILLGLCLQLHYLSLLLGAIIFIYIFLMTEHKKLKIIEIIKKYLSIIAGMLLSLSPLILFEFLHDFLNTKGIIAFLFGNTVNYSTNNNYFQIVGIVFFRIFARILDNFPAPSDPLKITNPNVIFIWGLFAVILAIASCWVLFKHRSKNVYLLFGCWLFVSIFLLGFYKKEIFDYLFTFIFPLPFLFTGSLLSYIYHKSKKNYIYALVSILLFIVIAVLNLINNQFRLEPNNQKNQAKLISQFVISKTNNMPYNFALLSKGNSDQAYRYYLEILGHSPVVLENLENDPKRTSATSQLLIVCEDINCNPIGNPIHEVAAFGRAEIAGVWNVSVVKVYRMVHYHK